MPSSDDAAGHPTPESDDIDQTWRWYYVERPEHAHTEALLRASPIRKGIYTLRRLDEPSQSQSGSDASSRPDHAPTDPLEAARPASPDEDRERIVRLDSGLLHNDEASMPPGGARLAVPFYDTLYPGRGCFQSRLIGCAQESQASVRDYYAHTAAHIYIGGQIRLGPARCTRCQDNEITRESDGDLLTHVDSPIPFCATAGQYHHAVCAPCFSEGGTLEEMFERCSLARMNTWEEYEALNRAVRGSLSREVFLGDGLDELQTAQAWIFEADV
ncbi:hypothetical protein QBC44DRAFT_392881 [Cladorrhinum sp. PSN332]|nr:hypothetical protein QBC44DRAFT_392881 [Cladorrhinum sp. PSN332]